MSTSAALKEAQDLAKAYADNERKRASLLGSNYLEEQEVSLLRSGDIFASEPILERFKESCARLTSSILDEALQNQPVKKAKEGKQQ